MRGDSNKLKLYTPTVDQSQEQELADRRTKRANNSFKRLHISIGEEIAFLYDDAIVAKVLDEKNQIEYDGVSYSVTGLAIKILSEKYGWADNIHVNGWKYFTKDGITLSDMRSNIENEDAEDE